MGIEAGVCAPCTEVVNPTCSSSCVGQIPQRVVWPGPVPASLNLALLESVLRHVGLNEVHKAVGLLLETLGTPPTGLHLQRYDFLGGVQLVLCLALSPILTCLLPPH